MDASELVSTKAAAKRELGHIAGVEGFGIGADTLRVYVKNPDVRERLPDEFRGVRVECVVVGDITPLAD
jgi:hypothetical protein